MQDARGTGTSRSLLVNEFSQWKAQNKTSLSLVSDSVCDDGRICLKFSLDRDKIFSLFCPAEYPHYEGNFFAESESVNHLWLNALNEFILDSDGDLKLESILWKANSLDSRVRHSPSNSSDDDDENEEFMVLEEEDEEDQIERALWDKEKQWRATEAKLRASLKEEENKSSDSHTHSALAVDKKKPKQIFSNSAASGILTNDLKHIIKTANETGINVEPIDNNIYDWSVRFSKFDPSSKLQQDLNLLKEAHGIDYIELQLEFTIDLYPFYPPVARMVRPRPEGSVRFMLACLDILKLSSWNPTCGMIVVLEEIKAYLAKHAILHVETAFKPSILLPIENSLLQLALVSEILPRDLTRSETSVSSPSSTSDPSSTSSTISSNPSTSGMNDASASTSSSSIPSTIPKSPQNSSSSGTSSTLVVCAPTAIPTSVLTSLPSNVQHLTAVSLFSKAKALALRNGKKTKFPDGTGYSTLSDKGWDINAHIAVEKEKDKKIEIVLQKILNDLKEYLKHKDCNSNFLSSSANECSADGEESRHSTNENMLEKKGLDPEAEFGVDRSLSRSSSGSNVSTNFYSASSSTGDPLQELFEALEASTLIPFIEQKLQVDSFLEICQHKSVYRCVIDILSEIAARPWLVRLLWKQPGQKKSIYMLLLALKEKAQKVLDRYKMAANSSQHTQSPQSAEKKGKKRANSGSREKDKTSRKSKVTPGSSSASTSASTSGDDVESPAAGPSSVLLPNHLQLDENGVSNAPFLLSTAQLKLNTYHDTSKKSKCTFKKADEKKADEVDGGVKDTEASASGPSGLSGFLSTFGLAWPSTWNVLNTDHEPPPVDVSTTLDPAGDEQLAQDFFDLAVKVEHVVNELGFHGSESPEHSDEPLELRRVSVPTGTSSVHDQELAATYIAALKELQFDGCDIDVSNTTSHHYANEFTSAIAPGRAQMMRIAQELASLSSSLPLDLASAIFVRSDDAKVTLLKALIIGPEGTPYASGCFLFDIFLPSNYPKSPPKVTIRTTGRGTVRFNPNLYVNGKVCLSLLGTWNGLQGEQWNETSTLLQVLVSIQSLIMVAEPYFNEPGYDSMVGTPDGKAHSDSYNHNIKLQTVRLAMLEMLKYPPADFEAVVRTHFRIKKNRILQDIEDYLAMYPNLQALSKAYKSLKVELSKLKD